MVEVDAVGGGEVRLGKTGVPAHPVDQGAGGDGVEGRGLLGPAVRARRSPHRPGRLEGTGLDCGIGHGVVSLSYARPLTAQ